MALEKATCNQWHPFPVLLPLLLVSEVLLNVAAAETERKKATIQTILGAK